MSQPKRNLDVVHEPVRFPAGVVIKPPVDIEDLRTDTEVDPAGAEEFVALMRALRREPPRSRVI